MEFSRLFLNRLHNFPHHSDAVVVIDTPRSFTTAAVALAGGARAVYPVEGLQAANTLADRLESPLLIGAVGGGDPAPGFDCGNSPSRVERARLRGRNVILSTAAGVLGLLRFYGAPALYAASLVCARATAEAIRASGAKSVCFVITGEWVDRDGDEDIACADYIEAWLRDEQPDPAEAAQRVRDSDFGRRFGEADWPNLPAADLELAAAVDCFEFAMPVSRQGEWLVIR